MTTANWTEGLSFITEPRGVEHKVGDQTLTFLPVSAMTLLKIKGLVGPIGECIAVLFDKKDNDTGSSQRSFSVPVEGEDGTVNETGTEVIIQPATEQVIALRMNKQEEAVQKLIKAVSENSNICALGEIVINSLRKQWTGKTAPPPQEFVEAVPLPQLVEMLVGVAKANEGVLGPLAGRLGGMSQQISAALDARLKEAEDADSPSTPTEEIQEKAGESW